MADLPVTYDLKVPGRDYTNFHSTIKKYNYARLPGSSCVLETTETPTDIFNKLFPHMEKYGQLHIAALRSPYWGLGPQEVNDWPAQRLV